jgi:hypothetical protein
MQVSSRKPSGTRIVIGAERHCGPLREVAQELFFFCGAHADYDIVLRQEILDIHLPSAL